MYIYVYAYLNILYIYMFLCFIWYTYIDITWLIGSLTVYIQKCNPGPLQQLHDDWGPTRTWLEILELLSACGRVSAGGRRTLPRLAAVKREIAGPSSIANGKWQKICCFDHLWRQWELMINDISIYINDCCIIVITCTIIFIIYEILISCWWIFLKKVSTGSCCKALTWALVGKPTPSALKPTTRPP